MFQVSDLAAGARPILEVGVWEGIPRAPCGAGCSPASTLVCELGRGWGTARSQSRSQSSSFPGCKRVRETGEKLLLPEGNGGKLTVSGFMVIGLLSGLSLASHSELASFLGDMHHSAEMDTTEEDPGKSVGPRDRSLPSLFNLSRILVAGSL